MNPADAAQDPMAGFDEFARNYKGPTFNNGSIPGNTPAQTNLPQKPQGDQGLLGWLENNASTIGGVVGGIGGELIDPFGGGIAGSAIGSGLGQEVQNLTTGSTTNPLESGLVGGASQALGGLAGKGISALASKGASIADRYGTDLLSQVGGTVDRRTARALDANGTTKFMSDLGVNPNDHKAVSQGVIDTLTPVVNKGVGMSKNVDTNGLHDMIDSLVNNETGLSGMASDKGTEAYKVAQVLKSKIDKLGNQANVTGAPLTIKTNPSGGAPAIGPTDILEPNANPSDTLDTIKSLQRNAAQLTGKGKNPLTVTERAQSEANVHRTLADELEDRLYTGAGADKVVAKGLIDDNVISKLQSALPDTPASKQFIESIKNAKTIKELRSAQAPFVNASQLASEKLASRATAGATNDSTVKQILGMGGIAAAPFTGGASVAIPAAEMVMGTDTGKTIAGNLLRKTAGNVSKLSNIGTGKAITIGGKNITARDVVNKAMQQSFGHLFTNNDLGGGANPNSTSSSANGNEVQGNTPLTGMLNNVINNYASSIHGTANTQQPQSLTPEQEQQIIQTSGLQGLAQARDTLQYNNDVIKMTQPQLSQTGQDTINLGLNSLSSLQQLAPLWEKAISSGGTGGALNNISKIPVIGGSIAGGVSELMKNTPAGSSYKTYMDNRYELASNLAKLVSNGGRSGGVAGTQAIEEQLPTLSDSPQTAMEKFTKVASMINASIQNVMQTPATNTYGSLKSFSQPGNTSGAGGNLPVLPPNLSSSGAF